MNSMKVDNLTDSLSDYSPFLILIVGMISFVLVGIFQFDFLYDKFLQRFNPRISASVAVLTVIAFQGARAAFMFTSSRDFAKGKIVAGWIGLTFSAVLVGYEIWKTEEIAMIWNSTFFSIFLKALVLLAAVCELRLILTMKKNSRSMKSFQNPWKNP